MVLTAGRRCSYHRLDEDSGAAWTYAVASGFLLCFGVPTRRGRPPPPAVTGSAPPGHERSPAAVRRQRRDAWLLLPRLHSSRSSPLLSPSQRRSLERGKIPSVLACERGSARGCRPRSRGKRAKPQHALLLAGAARPPTWRRGNGRRHRFMCGSRGVEMSFPPGETPRRAHGRAQAQRACQPAGRPSHCMRGAMRRGAVMVKNWRRRKKKRG
jgi:hypothetical protein